MTLTAMLQALEGVVKVLDRRGNLDVSVSTITDDSRAVSSGSLFVAVRRVNRWMVISLSRRR